MRAIWLVLLILMMAVTSTASGAVRVAPARGGTVQADSGTPAATLDMKNMPAGANLAEFVINVLRKGVSSPRTSSRIRRTVESKSLPQQMPQRSLSGCLRYPMRN